MAPIYLLNIYHLIEKQLAEVSIMQAGFEKTDPEKGQYLKGRVDALMEIQRFLKNDYEGKLPKRLRNKSISMSN